MVSVRRVAPVLLLAIALPVLAAVPRSSSHPPRGLHRVGDHWTAYDPPDPATYSPTAKTHVVKRGETLWALAQQYYGNAYLWPQLWESNTWITDAHWIYPGDVLLVEGETSQTATTGSAALTQSDTAETGELEPGPVASISAADMPVALAHEADLYCYGYLGSPNEPMPNRIASFEDVEILEEHPDTALASSNSVATGDLVFVEGGSLTGIAAGETYLLVEPGDIVKHPRTGAVIGQHYDYRGQLRILCTEEKRSRAIITQACKEINKGARLKPLPQLPIPIARIPAIPGICDAPTGAKPGYIVASNGWEFALGVGDLVEINLGRDDQIQSGDFLTVFRETGVADQPRQVLGEIAVLTTEGRTATARVVSMRRAMIVGDQLEMR